MTWILAFWVLMVLVGFAGSALYSGLETGAYSINRVRLHILDHRRDRAARKLRKMIARPTVLLSTLLIGNNLANQLGTSGLAVLLDTAGFGPWQTIILNTLIVTPLLFVFGETLPKDTFAAYADRLMYRLAPVLGASRWLFTVTGLAPIVAAFAWVVMKLIGGEGTFAPIHPRRQVEFLVKEGVGYGLLSSDQSAIVERVLDLSGRTVRDEMIPWPRVDKLRSHESADALWALAERTPHARLPVIDRGGAVVGVVNLLDALMHGREPCPPLVRLMTEPITFAATHPLRAALSDLRRRRAPLAIVTGGRGQPVGIVTIKDLIEPITGELTNW